MAAVSEPPCRRLERSTVECPTCGREMQLRTLTYSHRCQQSFRLEDRLARIAQRQQEQRQLQEQQERQGHLQQERRRPTAADLIAASLARSGRLR